MSQQQLSSEKAAAQRGTRFSSADFDRATLRQLYRKLLLPRLIEEKMLLLLRQGRLSKWFSGIGQEAMAAGCALAHGDALLKLIAY